ncbi:DUF1501 domain-containing protein [Anatilimnocola floriformis]|uniref:DUF1501 domain-containing protein n=1 Tax=Anatilimnocola floriformis TaxID=2948575 RepID=UPI0020C25310|nr:DUF1501 domain-containing protein [Anatilimnocola floriformis]
MFQINYGSTGRYCDGMSRRTALKLGFAGLGGMTLAGLYRAEAAAGITSSNKAVINIHLGGGPSHQDMFDLKPEAAQEFRGEFNPIKTNVPGFDICEHFPQLAKMTDKYAVIRSLIGMVDDHSNFHTQTGYPRSDLRNIGGRPGIGSVIARLMGPTGSGAPPFIAYNENPVGYLGPVYMAYRPSGGDLRLTGSMTADRLESRTNLLSSLDSIKREVDHSGQMKALDSFTQRAVGVVTSGDVANALDLQKEDPKVRERYGKDVDSFLTARRLVEAGVRVVTFDWGGWDTHSDNFSQLKKQLPKLDRAMSALISDLHERGMDKDVSIVMWGEFGRSPRINMTSGRDHWSRVAMCFLAGGGMKTGQFIGSSTKNAEEAKDRPIHLQEVFSTLYHNMGIDCNKTSIIDPAGRPQFLTDHRDPIKELV